MRQNSQMAMERRATEHWEREFARRMVLAEPKDTIRGVLCNGMLRVVRSLGGEEMVKRCLEASGEEKFVDFFNYPIALYLRMISAAMRLLEEKHGDVEAALRQLGRQAVADVEGSAAGKALELLMSAGDMRSTLEGLPLGYRIAVSTGEQKLVWTGPTSARLTIKRGFLPPAFHEGVLMAVIEPRNMRSVQVRGRQTGPLDSEYELSWEWPRA
jgi:uncharacterized protein (TIGR02265 family)